MADETVKQDAPTAAPSSSAPRSESRPHSGGSRPGGGSREGGPRGSRPPGGPGGSAGGREGGGGAGGRKFFRRKKVCKFCTEKIPTINYKDVKVLQQFVAIESGKIVPRRLSGICTRHQRGLSAAIKQARNIALLPFSARHK